jgi:hypothetical protein
MTEPKLNTQTEHPNWTPKLNTQTRNQFRNWMTTICCHYDTTLHHLFITNTTLPSTEPVRYTAIPLYRYTAHHVV